MGKVGRRGPHKARKARIAAERAEVSLIQKHKREQELEERRAENQMIRQENWNFRMSRTQWHPIKPQIGLGLSSETRGVSYCWELIKFMNHQRQQRDRGSMLGALAGIMGTLNWLQPPRRRGR